MKPRSLVCGLQLLVLAAGVLLCHPLETFAQAPGVPIERGTVVAVDKQAIKKANSLRKARKLLTQGEVAAQLAKPRSEKFTLPAPQTRELPPREIYQRARAAFVRIGWLFRESPDEPWGLDMANAYAIAEGGVIATAAHTLESREGIDEAYLVALTADGHAMPVTAILAADMTMDAAVVRVAGFPGKPLPLSEDVAPGDKAYCFSDPYEERGFFATGHVNRFYWCDNDDGDLKSFEGIKNLRFDVSTEWAPGSSGAAILDGAGNVIGHACSITSFTVPPNLLPPEEEGEDSPDDVAKTAPGEAAPPAAKAPSDEAVGEEAAGDATLQEDLLEGDAQGVEPYFQIQSAVPVRSLRLLIEATPPSK